MCKTFVFAACCGMAVMTASAVTLVSVGDGETLTLAGSGSGNNTADTEITAAAGATIVLNAADSGGASRILSKLYLTGSGTVTLAAPDSGYAATEVRIEGGIAAATPANMTLHVGAASVTAFKVGVRMADNAVNTPVVDLKQITFANTSGAFHLTESVTAIAVPTGCVVDDGANVALYGNPLGFGKAVMLDRYDLVLLSSASVPSGCTVTVNPGRTLALKGCIKSKPDGWSYAWNWNHIHSGFGDFNVKLNGRGARVICRNSNNLQLRLTANVTGVGEVLCRTDSGNSRTFFKGMSYVAQSNKPVAIPINTVADWAAERADKNSWTNKVASWFDASDAASIIEYSKANTTSLRYNFEGNDNQPVVVGWLDHVKGHDGTFFYNRDAQNGVYPYFLPFLVKGGLNGKAYLSFGKYDTAVDPADCNTSDNKPRRGIRFVNSCATVSGSAKPSGGDGGGYATPSYPYCIMVFGSQNGGGKAILNDKCGTGLGNLARTSPYTGSPWTAYDGYSMTVDGYSIDPKTSKPNGGWQIVSLDMSATNTVLYGLSGHNITSYNSSSVYGNVDYAEIIFFSEVPTADERAACERYLAEKWGLTETYNNWDTSYVELSGRGWVDFWDTNIETHQGAAEIAVAGNFAGTLRTRAGQTLVLSDRPAPPSAADLPQQDSITGWYDPSFEGAIVHHKNTNTDSVSNLCSRTAAGIVEDNVMRGRAPDGSQSPVVASASRLGASGVGPVMNWMDFTHKSASNLRSCDDRWNTIRLDVRSVFMSLDSSFGGGNPFAFDAYMYNSGSLIRPRLGYDWTAPIWSSSNQVAMAHTWLDATEVDGSSTGFNGRAEVLGFELASAQNSQSFLGYCLETRPNGGANYEYIGETIIYSTTLTAAERGTVQDYLMAKWLGDTQGKYTDLSGATVKGAGDVYSVSLRNLPAFDSDFTGTLRGGANMSFTVDPTVNGTAATDAVTITAGNFSLDAACTVSVTLKGAAKAGTYTLLTVPSGALSGKTFDLSFTDATGKNRRARLVTGDTTLSLQVYPVGFMVIFK